MYSFALQPSASTGSGVMDFSTRRNVRCLLNFKEDLGLDARVLQFDAVIRAQRQAYDAKTFKKSTIRRKMAGYAGKNWVKKDSNKYLWCIVITLLEEIFTQAIEMKGGDKTRITSQSIYKAIAAHPDNLLQPFKTYIGEGVGFA